MWQCPVCKRNFKQTNQFHMCTTKDIGELFLGKPDELVLAYDDLVQGMAGWEPNSIGASIHSIVMTSKKAWLIIKPMKSQLDVKFYTDDPPISKRIKKTTSYRNKFACHIRIAHPDEIDEEVFFLLRKGFEHSLE
ncbi:MAG: DUF5655 domain-containing protein [Bacteroidota bacterium]